MSSTGERRLIGHVCGESNYVHLVGNWDYEVCSSRPYAEVYVTVTYNQDVTPDFGRGREPDLDEIAKHISDAVEDQESYGSYRATLDEYPGERW